MMNKRLLEQYKPSASLIIAAKEPNDSNFKVLLCKRTLATSVAPDHCVFPGGKLEQFSDESCEWLDYFRVCGLQEEALIDQNNRAHRPYPLFKEETGISRDISLRITAIRETFEEVGILFCRPSSEIGKQKIIGSFKEDFDRIHWQKIVHHNPAKFLELCRHLKVVPDIWSLAEWSAWRTPFTSTKKYDTAYYLVMTDKIPNVLLEPKEMQDFYWLRPSQTIRYFEEGEIWLPSSIYYEICCLASKTDFDQLFTFLERRKNNSTKLWVPVFLQALDGMMMLLQGDSLYPENPYERLKIEGDPVTINELNRKSVRRHRIIMYNMQKYSIEYNITENSNSMKPLKIFHHMCLSKI